jgi:hypothetical protein
LLLPLASIDHKIAPAMSVEIAETQVLRTNMAVLPAPLQRKEETEHGHARLRQCSRLSPEGRNSVVMREDDRTKLLLRLGVLNAYLLAAERRGEVMRTIAVAANPDDARAAVAELLGITPADAVGVVDLRLVHFGQDEVAKHRSERDWILAELH